MAGAVMRDIKRRTRAITNIRQITRAMELVSSIKMRRSRELLNTTRPYSQIIEEVVNDIIAYTEKSGHEINEGEIAHILMTAREVKKTCYIVICSDRGLAGSYNINVIREAQNHMAENKRDDVSVVAIGQKSRDHFRRENFDIKGEFTQISEDPTIADAKSIAELCIELYTQGLVDEVHLVYTGFITTINYEPTVTQLLPLKPKTKETTEDDREADDSEAVKFMLYEPSVERVLDYLIPKYIESMIFWALAESAASEQSARRVAMKNATDNAGELIEDLQLEYHRARQASITQEIAEVVSGADALD